MHVFSTKALSVSSSWFLPVVDRFVFCFTSLNFQQKKMLAVGTWRLPTFWSWDLAVFADIFGMPEQKPASLGTWSFCAGELLSPTTFDSRGWDWVYPAGCVKLPGRRRETHRKMTCWSCVCCWLFSPGKLLKAILKLKEHSTKWHPGRVRVWVCACVFPVWNT